MSVSIRESSELHVLELVVNGEPRQVSVEGRRLLVDVLREDLGLTGTNVGCGQGVCGSCTVLLDGSAARSCLVLGVQAAGQEISTVEGLAQEGLHEVQQAFLDAQAQQCGFCTPGFLMQTVEIVDKHPDASRDELRGLLAGNLCRCTGYEHIVDAVQAVLERRAEVQS